MAPDLLEYGQEAAPQVLATPRGLVDQRLVEVADVDKRTPMPPETREAIRILAFSRNPDADRSQAREQIEALADQLEQRTDGKRDQ